MVQVSAVCIHRPTCWHCTTLTRTRSGLSDRTQQIKTVGPVDRKLYHLHSTRRSGTIRTRSFVYKWSCTQIIVYTKYRNPTSSFFDILFFVSLISTTFTRTVEHHCSAHAHHEFMLTVQWCSFMIVLHCIIMNHSRLINFSLLLAHLTSRTSFNSIWCQTCRLTTRLHCHSCEIMSQSVGLLRKGLNASFYLHNCVCWYHVSRIFSEMQIEGFFYKGGISILAINNWNKFVINSKSSTDRLRYLILAI
jgi:hypothetical protein